MNTERTHFYPVDIMVESWSDGVYNLKIRKDNLQEESVSISEEQAERLCEILDEEVVDAEPTPPKRMG